MGRPPERDRRRILLGPAALGAAVLLGGLALALADSQRDARRTIEQRFASGTGTAAALVETIMTQGYANIAQTAERGLPGARISDRDVALLARRLDARSIVVLGERGTPLASAPAGARLAPGPDGHRRAALRGRPAISGRLQVRRSAMIEIAVPFRAQGGPRVVVAALPARRLQTVLAPYLRRIPGAGDRRAYILDHRRGLATVVDSRLGMPAERDLTRSLRGRPAAGAGTYAGGERAFSSDAIAGTQWMLVRTTTTDALYSPVSGWPQKLPWALLIVLVGAGAGIVALADRAWRSAARDRQANQAKSAFLGHMSHELRTAMTTVIGFGELLASGRLGPLTPRQAEALAHITSSSGHLNQLISEILDLARVEEGRMPFCPEPIEPHVLVHEVADSMRGLAGDRSIDVRVNAPDIGIRRLDPARFKQVLYNLIGNAIKFTEAGGEVRVRLWADGDGGDIGVEIADTGVGIAPEDLDRIFLPFEQSARRNGGAGLGLAITQRIVDAQGGRVSVRSVPGDGSVFRVSLPAAA